MSEVLALAFVVTQVNSLVHLFRTSHRSYRAMVLMPLSRKVQDQAENKYDPEYQT